MKKSAIISLITLLFSFGVQMVANRHLGPSGRGDYALLLLIPQTAGALLAFGFPSAIVYFYNRSAHKFRRYLFGCLAAICALATLGAAASWLLVPGVFSQAGATSLTRGELTVLASVGSLIVALSTFAAAATQIRPERHFFEKSRFLQVLVLFAGTWLLVAGGALTPLNLFLLFCGSFFVQFIAAFWASLSFSRIEPPTTAGPAADTTFIRFAASVFLMDACSTLAVNLDKFFLASRVTAADIGLYAAAFALSRVFAPIAQTLAFRTFSESAALKTADRAAHTVSRARFIALFSAVCALPLIVAPHLVLLLLFGASYQAAALPLVILAVESVIGNVMWNAAQIFAADGKPGVTALRQAAGLAVLVITCPFFIGAWGIVGCALSLLAATLTRSAITAWMLARHHGISATSLIPGKSDFLTAAAPFLRRTPLFQILYAKN